MKDKFNRYCAEVVGYEVNDSPSFLSHCISVIDNEGFGIDYKPYDDLNQMADVVEKLLSNPNNHHPHLTNIGYSIMKTSTKQAFRDFIISAMPEEDESNE